MYGIGKIHFNGWMKVGKILGNLETLLFWKLAYFFINQHGFRLVSMSENERELWLENRDHETVQAVRLLRVDLTWSSLVARDIERTAQKGDLLRKRLFMRNMNVLNLYISSYEPVGDYSFVDEPFLFPKGKKTRVISKIFERQHYAERLSWLAGMFSGELVIPEELESPTEEADNWKSRVLEEDMQRFKREKSIFFFTERLFFTYIFYGRANYCFYPDGIGRRQQKFRYFDRFWREI